MAVLYSFTKLTHQMCNLPMRHQFATHLIESWAIDELHHEIWRAFMFACREQPSDVLMLESGQRANLGFEPLSHGGFFA